MRKAVSVLILTLAPLAAAEDEPLRLPGQGEVRAELGRRNAPPDRLVAGGGLLMSFDLDGDGFVDRPEVSEGITTAFADADANGDGGLTPLEQAAWIERLPTRDESLANPVRFDPNLDRRVSFEEFAAVVTDFAAIYADETTGVIDLASLRVEGPRQASGDEADPRAAAAGRRPPSERQRPTRGGSGS